MNAVRPASAWLGSVTLKCLVFPDTFLRVRTTAGSTISEVTARDTTMTFTTFVSVF